MKTAKNKTDSKKVATLNKPAKASNKATPSSRATRKQGAAIHKSTQVDSKEKVDCHADFQSARNDRKNAPSKKVDSSNTAPHSHCETSAGSRGNPKKVDSRKTTQNPQSHNSTNAALRLHRFAGFGGFQGGGEGIYLGDNEQAPAAESAKSAQKPTPKQNSTTSTDILTCLANLSTDEVFTPPHIVNAMLDLLPRELFSDPSATFLDPACKSGVFLREIARRLMLGLESHFPEPSERIAHILTHQLYGIAITELTALLSRRTLYGSKDVDNPRYSIPKRAGAALPQGGNIYYAPTPHSFKNAKCTYCGASQSQYDRDSTLESYAYAFIHELEPLKQFFSTIHPQGVPMSFSVIIGNPPYQLSDGGAGASAKPLYNKFIDRAKALSPKHIVMIVPARWYAGGKGLGDFRASMLNDSRLVELHDFPNASDCFPDNEIKGGVCYFRWDSAAKNLIRGGGSSISAKSTPTEMALS